MFIIANLNLIVLVVLNISLKNLKLAVFVNHFINQMNLIMKFIVEFVKRIFVMFARVINTIQNLVSLVSMTQFVNIYTTLFTTKEK